MSVINNVVFNYVKIKKPAPKYGEDPGCPINNCEYSVDVCIPFETVNKLKKKYKTIKAVKNMAAYDAEDYKKTFKVDAPNPEVYANQSGEYFVLKLTAYAGYLDGTPVPEGKIPRVVGTKTRTTDSSGKTVGRNIEVGNGSTGRVSFVERSWEYKGSTGLSLDLTGIQIDNLIEYFSKNHENVNEFEFEEEDEEFGYDPDSDEKPPKEEPNGDGTTPEDEDEW